MNGGICALCVLLEMIGKSTLKGTNTKCNVRNLQDDFVFATIIFYLNYMEGHLILS